MQNEDTVPILSIQHPPRPPPSSLVLPRPSSSSSGLPLPPLASPLPWVTAGGHGRLVGRGGGDFQGGRFLEGGGVEISGWEISMGEIT